MISGLTLLTTCILPSLNSADVYVDVTDRRGEIADIVNTLNVWSPYAFNENTQPDPENDVMSFVDYIELMSATGGNAELDPFVDPLDRTVLDDYDFSRIVASCRGIKNLGATPFIVLGNIPMKLSAEPKIDFFEVNVCPPEDYDEWYRFLRAYIKALTDEFGVEDVKTWRFGVFTEYENAEWFSVDGDPDKTFVEYCKIYDYSVKALTDALGEDVYVGAHSMTVTEGLWDERDFIRHCALGTNYATGEKGTRICYLTSSFYDTTVYDKTSGKRPADCIRFLRNTAESYGLYGLDYGFDEGRIYGGTAGVDSNQLVPRSVGQTVQAAYDSRLYKELAECGASWFSSWGYTTGGAVNGFPSVAYHTASLFSRLHGKTAVGVKTTENGVVKDAEKQAFAAKDTETGTVFLSASNYKPSRYYFSPSKMNFTVKDPSLTGKVVEIRTYLINDDCNFFDEWQKDAKKYIDDGAATSWSPDGYTLDGNILPEKLREAYQSELREKYKKCAKLIYTCDYVEFGESISFSVNVDPNSAVFVEIVPKKGFSENS